VGEHDRRGPRPAHFDSRELGETLSSDLVQGAIVLDEVCNGFTSGTSARR
jgi:hypothetical protein